MDEKIDKLAEKVLEEVKRWKRIHNDVVDRLLLDYIREIIKEELEKCSLDFL